MSDVKMPAKQIVSCGDISCELLVDPIPRPKPDPIKITVKPKKRRVVLIDSKKPNSIAILRSAQAKFRDLGIEVRDDIPAKPIASEAMPEALLDELAKDPGLILCGVSD